MNAFRRMAFKGKALRPIRWYLKKRIDSQIKMELPEYKDFLCSYTEALRCYYYRIQPGNLAHCPWRFRLLYGGKFQSPFELNN